MEMINLSATVRQPGKGMTAKLRKEGMIPAVVYGGKDNLSVAINAREFDNKFNTVSENSIIDLDVEGNNVHVLIKEYQKDWMRNKMIHIDFLEITKGKELKTHIPVKIVGAGSSAGERAGGILEVYLHDLEVVCLPKDLPSEFEVDVESLEIGDLVHVSDLKIGEEVKVLTSPDTVIAVVEHAKEVSLEPDTAEDVEGDEDAVSEGESATEEGAGAESDSE